MSELSAPALGAPAFLRSAGRHPLSAVIMHFGATAPQGMTRALAQGNPRIVLLYDRWACGPRPCLLYRSVRQRLPQQQWYGESIDPSCARTTASFCGVDPGASGVLPARCLRLLRLGGTRGAVVERQRATGLRPD